MHAGWGEVPSVEGWTLIVSVGAVEGRIAMVWELPMYCDVLCGKILKKIRGLRATDVVDVREGHGAAQELLKLCTICS